MGTYRKTFLLDAHPQRVWALMADPDRLPEWNGAFDRVTEATGRLDEVGVTYSQVMKVAGVELHGDWEITGVEANQRREFSGRPPGMIRCEGVESFHEVDGLTEYTVEMNYTLVGGPAAALLDRLFGRVLVARVIENNIDGLRPLLEP